MQASGSSCGSLRSRPDHFNHWQQHQPKISKYGQVANVSCGQLQSTGSSPCAAPCGGHWLSHQWAPAATGGAEQAGRQAAQHGPQQGPERGPTSVSAASQDQRSFCNRAIPSTRFQHTPGACRCSSCNRARAPFNCLQLQSLLPCPRCSYSSSLLSHLVSWPHHDLIAWRLALDFDRATHRVNHHVLARVLQCKQI
jgi:hypothetical protein